jgi:gliding motility-associated-like protein
MKRILLLLMFGLGLTFSQAQTPITVDATLTPQDLIDIVLVQGPCANVSNVTSPNNSIVGGDSFQSFGSFDGSATNPAFPFNSGIILASNGVQMIPTGVPAQGGGFGWDGDPDLAALAGGGITRNATVIEFEFIPYVQEISFNYFLASEEWPTYVCNFADTFAFILSGPGISNVNDYNHDANPNTPDLSLDLGGLNIATIPGTNIPVNPTNIHTLTNPCVGQLGEFAVPQLYDNVGEDDGTTMYFGRTVPMAATAQVIPGQTYNIKLAVADRSDTILNTAVFIQSASFDLGEIDLGEDFLTADDTAACDGDSVTLETGFSLPNSQTFWALDGQIIPGESGDTLTVTQPGSYEAGLQIVNQDGSICFAISQPTVVEFFPQPDFDPITDLTICDGETVNLDLTPLNVADYSNITYEWSLDGNVLPGQTNSSINISQPGQYEVSLDANACLDFTKVVDVTVIDYTTSIQDPGVECLNPGDIITLSAEFTTLTQDQIDNDVTYEWTTDDGTFNTPTIDITEGQTVTLTTTFQGCPESDTQTFTFFNNPIVDITGPVVVCDGETITLDGTPSNLAELTGATYSWFLDGNEITGETNQTIDITQGGSYEVVVDNNGCGTTSSSFDVELIDYSVSLPAVSDPCISSGSTVTVTADFNNTLTQDEIDNEVTYEWTVGNDTFNTPEIELSEGQEVTLTTTFNGCVESVTETFTFFNTPEVGITGSATVCDGETITLDGTPSNLASLSSPTYSWLLDGNPIAGDMATIDVTQGGTYEVTVENNGCSDSATFDVELINYTVSLPAVQDPCISSGSTVTVTADFNNTLTQDQIDNEVTYEWTVGNDTFNTPEIELSEGQEVTLTTTFNGCPESVTETFTFFNTPEVDIAGADILCAGETNTLNATPLNLNDLDPDNTTYSWTLNGNPIPGDGPVLDITEGGEYIVTINNNNCVETDTFNVESVDLAVSFDEENIVICSGGTVTLDPTIGGNLTPAQENQIFYLWSDGSDGETLTVSEGGTYTVEVDINGDCAKSAEVNVVITETIQVALEGAIKCPDDPVTLQAVLLSDNDPGVTYIWSYEGNVLASETAAALTVDAEDTGSYTVVANNQGCLSNPVTVSVTNYDVDNCVITQGLSPDINNDGKNDCMDLTWLSDESGIKKMSVFNRYGQLVFEEDNYENTFCGQDRNGNNLSTGTYFYVIELESESERLQKGPVIKGWVYINTEQQ